MQRHRIGMAHWLIWILAVSGCAFAQGRATGSPPDNSTASQKVFTDAGVLGNELVFDIHRNVLRIRKANYFSSTEIFSVDGDKFRYRPNEAATNYDRYRIEAKLSIREGALYFDRNPVSLPNKAKMRNVWQAVLWNGWVICLGRTSNTDRTAESYPPRFASELITFNVTERRAAVRYLNFDPPSGIRLYVLKPAP